MAREILKFQLVSIHVVGYINPSQISKLQVWTEMVCRGGYYLEMHPSLFEKVIRNGKNVFTKVTIDGKILAAWPKLLDLRWGI